MEHMTAGYDSGDETMLEALAYVSFQELATRVAHRNTGRRLAAPLPSSCSLAYPRMRTCTWCSTAT